MPKITSLDPMMVAYLRRHLAMLDAEREAFGTATTDLAAYGERHE